MKAITTITLSKQIPENQISAVKNMIDNEPQQIEEAIALMKSVVTEMFAINGEVVDVNFDYVE